MITQRIDALKIEKRGLFTAIYGVNRTSEIYITADLKIHSLYEALYLYLRQQGYITVFYDNKAFSFEENQLIQFFGFTARGDNKSNVSAVSIKHIENHRDFFKGKGPMSKTRDMRQSTNLLTNIPLEHSCHHDAIRLIDNDLEHSYVVTQSEGFFGSINSMVERDAKRKVAVVFVNPNTLEYNEDEQKIYENYLSTLRTKYIKSCIGLKLIALYDFVSPEAFTQELENGSSKFLMRPPFKDLIKNDLKPTTDAEGNAERKEMKTVFFLNDPERDEISNMLNRKRLLENLPHAFNKTPWEHIVLRFWQGISTQKDDKDKTTLRLMRDFYQISTSELDEIIENMDTIKAIDKLNALQGIDNIKEQFSRYRLALRAHRLGQGGGRFRPHMVLMGSPGTGKSTVARLFGDILREDGLLPKGHFVKVDVSELVGEYIGSTRPKTRAVCERARGGVLFIDEAYGLMSGSNTHGDVDYGKEAIEVLIQFMEDSDDSLVVLAGYTNEINHLINEGNVGFRRRFNELGFFHFYDYKPQVLFDIAIKMIPYPVTVGFKKALLGILQFKYAYRTKKFGNVGDVENMVNVIVGSYRNCGGNGPVDVIHLPENLRILVDSSMLNERMMLQELNSLIGQYEVKSLVKNLFTKVFADRIRLQTISGYTPEIPQLNFIFSGNPGTGKTTIARIIGNVMQRLGILSSTDGEIINEIAGNDLLTASSSTVKELFESSIGKVLFIDEAYQLRESPRIIADIVGNITNRDYQNKLCLIMAGYTDDMRQMMNVNSGMQRRFQVVHFSDYTNEELWEILLRQVKNPATQVLMDAETCKQPAIKYFASLTRDRNFGNAGVVSNLLDFLKDNREVRYVKATLEQQADPDFAKRILPEDFPQIDSDINDLQEIHFKIRNKKTLSMQKIAVCDKVIDCSNEDTSQIVSQGNDLYSSVGLIETSFGYGTAFVISIKNRYLVTASHVVEGATDLFFTLNIHGNITRTPVCLLWNNPMHDFAILQANYLPKNVKYFIFDRDTPRIPATKLRIAAFPMGRQVSNCMLLTEGIISNSEKSICITNEKGEQRVFDVIRTEAQATHGSSGGPVMLADTMHIVGVLHGGVTENGFSMNIASDTNQLFNESSLEIKI